MQNTNSITLNLELNKSHVNKRGFHSVRLLVYDTFSKKRCYLKTPFKLSENDFKNSWVKNKSSPKHRNMKLEMSKFLNKADDCIKELGGFDKDEFKEVFYGSGKTTKNLEYYYDKKISDFKEIGSYGTASQYKSSQNFLKKYNNNKHLEFSQIDSKWLYKFDNYCTEKGLLSTSSLGIYLRPLRAIFNLAIHEGVILREKYPFGKYGYTIPSGENVKKALTKEQVQKLFDSKPTNPYQIMAKDFWFFSFISNGLNLKDILMIKNKDLNEDYFLFSRKKTIHTVKKRSTAKVYLTDFTRSVITRYGNPDPNKPEEYVFNILNTKMDNNEKHIKKKNFNRKINQHFLKFVKSTGINEEISFAWARHSFATIAILSGIRIEAVSNRLNHTSLETTMLYFKGFEEETYRKINDKILEYSRENDLNGHLSIQNSILD